MKALWMCVPLWKWIEHPAMLEPRWHSSYFCHIPSSLCIVVGGVWLWQMACRGILMWAWIGRYHGNGFLLRHQHAWITCSCVTGFDFSLLLNSMMRVSQFWVEFQGIRNQITALPVLHMTMQFVSLAILGIQKCQHKLCVMDVWQHT